MSTALRYMPCGEFEQAIHAFVDGEIAATDSRNLLVHLELCGPCSGSVEMLRKQIRVHRESLDLDRLVAAVDKNDLFRSLNRKLLEGNLERLATLLYELGKAYFLAGNDARLVTFVHKKALAIERAKGEGRRLVKESAGVAARAAAVGRREREALRRSEQLVRGRRPARIGARSGRGPLDNARRFLEESLVLAPGLVQARLYLGVYYVRVDRPDEAVEEYRKILAQPGLPATLRVMTLQALGNAHAYRCDYARAVETFEEIVATGILEQDSRFFTVLLSLAMFHAKLGRFERSTAVFGDLVRRFPDRLAEARAMLGQAEVFRALLEREERFRSELIERYPMLFAG